MDALHRKERGSSKHHEALLEVDVFYQTEAVCETCDRGDTGVTQVHHMDGHTQNNICPCIPDCCRDSAQVHSSLNSNLGEDMRGKSQGLASNAQLGRQVTDSRLKFIF